MIERYYKKKDIIKALLKHEIAAVLATTTLCKQSLQKALTLSGCLCVRRTVRA